MESNKKNEQTFTNMAMTFSMEGVTKDVQEIIQKKMNFHIKALKEIGEIINSIASSKDMRIRKKLIEESDISSLVHITVEDYKVIVGSTTLVLQELLKKKQFITDEIVEEARK